jgi:hypothetical protein
MSNASASDFTAAVNVMGETLQKLNLNLTSLRKDFNEFKRLYLPNIESKSSFISQAASNSHFNKHIILLQIHFTKHHFIANHTTHLSIWIQLEIEFILHRKSSTLCYHTTGCFHICVCSSHFKQMILQQIHFSSPIKKLAHSKDMYIILQSKSRHENPLTMLQLPIDITSSSQLYSWQYIRWDTDYSIVR